MYSGKSKKDDCDVTQLLKEHELNHTKDRHSIINLFLEHRAWTARQIKNGFGFTSTSTIYRNISALLKKGLLKEIHTHDGEKYYEWAARDHHDHLACNKCDVLECVPCPVPKLKKHLLEIDGLCSACK